MPTINLPSEIGFAEFVSMLIGEVFDSVVAADVAQEQRRAELHDDASLSLSVASERLVDEPEVDARLASLFPSPVAGVPHGIFPGARYQPAGREITEEPRFSDTLGVSLVSNLDYDTEAGGGQVLTADGVAKIRNATRLLLAGARLDALGRIAARGHPRVVVDSGRVRATLSLRLDQTNPVQRRFFVTAIPPPVAGRGKFALEAPAAVATKTLRLAVRLASDRAPQVGTLQVDVYGGVEIQFKTIL